MVDDFILVGVVASVGIMPFAWHPTRGSRVVSVKLNSFSGSKTLLQSQNGFFVYRNEFKSTKMLLFPTEWQTLQTTPRNCRTAEILSVHSSNRFGRNRLLNVGNRPFYGLIILRQSTLDSTQMIWYTSCSEARTIFTQNLHMLWRFIFLGRKMLFCLVSKIVWKEIAGVYWILNCRESLSKIKLVCDLLYSHSLIWFIAWQLIDC